MFSVGRERASSKLSPKVRVGVARASQQSASRIINLAQFTVQTQQYTTPCLFIPPQFSFRISFAPPPLLPSHCDNKKTRPIVSDRVLRDVSILIQSSLKITNTITYTHQGEGGKADHRHGKSSVPRRRTSHRQHHVRTLKLSEHQHRRSQFHLVCIFFFPSCYFTSSPKSPSPKVAKSSFDRLEQLLQQQQIYIGWPVWITLGMERHDRGRLCQSLTVSW